MSSALVKVNEQNAQRLDRYFRKQLPAENTSQPSFEAVEVEVTLPGAGAGGGDIVTKRNGNHYVAPDAEALSYDDDGNLVSDGRWVYAWDGENRLTVMETTTAAVSAGVPKRKLAFAYDGQNRRIRKQVYHWDAGSSSWTLNSERRFVYDQWNLVAEVDASGDLLKSHVWGMDLSQTAQGAGGVGGLLWSNDYEKGHTHFAAYDGNGNITSLVNANTAAVQARYDYNAFGETVLIEGGEIAEGNTFRFSTKYEDAETGLYYYGYRYYSPNLGRWINRVPLEEIVETNIYKFTNNDPINIFDNFGLFGDWIPIYGTIKMAIQTALEKYPGMESSDYASAQSSPSGDLDGEICRDEIRKLLTKYTIDMVTPNVIRYATDVGLSILSIIPLPHTKIASLVGIVDGIANIAVTVWATSKIKSASEEAATIYCACPPT